MTLSTIVKTLLLLHGIQCVLTEKVDCERWPTLRDQKNIFFYNVNYNEKAFSMMVCWPGEYVPIRQVCLTNIDRKSNDKCQTLGEGECSVTFRGLRVKPYLSASNYYASNVRGYLRVLCYGGGTRKLEFDRSVNWLRHDLPRHDMPYPTEGCTYSEQQFIDMGIECSRLHTSHECTQLKAYRECYNMIQSCKVPDVHRYQQELKKAIFVSAVLKYRHFCEAEGKEQVDCKRWPILWDEDTVEYDVNYKDKTVTLTLCSPSDNVPLKEVCPVNEDLKQTNECQIVGQGKCTVTFRVLGLCKPGKYPFDFAKDRTLVQVSMRPLCFEGNESSGPLNTPLRHFLTWVPNYGPTGTC